MNTCLRLLDSPYAALTQVMRRGLTLSYVSSDRDIPSRNIDLHFAHCSRNLERCKVCGDMVPKKHAEEHYLNTHAPVRRLVPDLRHVICLMELN